MNILELKAATRSTIVIESWNHRKIQSRNSLVWNRTLESSSPIPLSMAMDISHYIRLPKGPSNPAFNTASDGASTTSLGNMFQCLNTLILKSFFFIPNLYLHAFGSKT